MSPSGPGGPMPPHDPRLGNGAPSRPGPPQRSRSGCVPIGLSILGIGASLLILLYAGVAYASISGAIPWIFPAAVSLVKTLLIVPLVVALIAAALGVLAAVIGRGAGRVFGCVCIVLGVVAAVALWLGPLSLYLSFISG